MNKITAKQVVAEKSSRRELKTLGSNIFYLEKRPAEGGRTTLIYRDHEVLPKEFNIKSKVHEYGGGAYAVSTKRVLFVNKKDQQIYSMDNQFNITKLTDYEDCRFADGVIDEENKCSYWVCEKHSANHHVDNSLVRISHAEGKEFGRRTVVAHGHDFFASPVLSKKGQLAFVSWNHPNMPWDDTYLHLGTLVNGHWDMEIIDQNSWISEPQFNDEGDLYYIKEHANFSNICLYTKDKTCSVVLDNNREYALPGWNFGIRTYALYKDKIIASSWKDGLMQLEIINKGQSQVILTEYSGFANPQISHDNLIVECYNFDKDSELVSFDLNTLVKTVLIASEAPAFEVSKPEPVTFDSLNGKAHGFLYLPVGKKTDLPLMVISHGGPTGMSDSFFDINIQYWTDKGFAVFDVNYRGSTGYGKEYRNALKGNWGVYDVADCENAALYCVAKGIANKDQLIIRGASAGGYTTMAALTFTDTFKAGASYFGICDLNMLAESTHKFESRYMDTLIAPYVDNKDIFKARSPVNYMERISCPMIVFQGEDDMVVPKDQAETIYKNLTEKKVLCELFLFPEEGHGFGKEENLITCLTSELDFYKKVFSF